MRKQEVVKTECAGVFPFIGSPEEGRNKKIRTLRVVGFRLTPGQAIDAATALLQQAKSAQASGEKHAVLDVLARRKEGASVVMVQTAVAPPERKKKVAKTNGANGHSPIAAVPAPTASKKSAAKSTATEAATPKQRQPRARKTQSPAPVAAATPSAAASEAA